MDIVVVGGGIVGLSSAYYLANMGADVTLCEKGALGMQSTARSAGGIRSQFSAPVNIELSIASRKVWNEFEERFGVDIAYRKSGYLFLARSDTTAEQFRKSVTIQNDIGVDSRFLSPEDIAEYCPGLLSERFTAATYNATDGYADPNLAVQGYAEHARRIGVDVRTKTAVVDLRTDGTRVTGVETESETIDSEFVVNAAGAWASELGAMAGDSLPIEPRRRQVAIVDPTKALPEDLPLTIDLDTGSYFRPEREGAALVGGHFANEDEDQPVNPNNYSTSMDLNWAAAAVEHAADYTSYFDDNSKIKRGWTGLYAVTPDHHPIIEETVPGLITAAGFSGHGFQHAPATGQIVAELCANGEASLVDVSSLTSDRFDKRDPLSEQNVA